MNDENTQAAGDETEGHAFRAALGLPKDSDGEGTEGHRFAARGLSEEPDGEGTEGHRAQIRPEDTDTEGHGFRAMAVPEESDDEGTEGHLRSL